MVRKISIFLLMVLGLFGLQAACPQSNGMKQVSTIEDPKIMEYPSEYRDQKIHLEFKRDKLAKVNRELKVKFEGQSPVLRIIDGNSSLVNIIKFGIYSSSDMEEKWTHLRQSQKSRFRPSPIRI